jgi:sterile alpha motif and leucine zipper-containing kinase AZK
VFSFSIVFWECLTREDPYATLQPFQVVLAVGTQGLRPPIPEGTAPKVVELLKTCWHEDPSRRPSFDDIILMLNMITSLVEQ